MKVLKFGGTSVASADEIRSVGEIIQKTGDAPLIVVVSAMGGVTDTLLTSLNRAAARDESFRAEIERIRQRHHETIEQLIPEAERADLFAGLQSSVEELRTLLEGAFLIGESTDRLRDRVAGYGEWLSAVQINAYLQATGTHAALKDGRDLIRTDQRFGKARVEFALTNELCRTYFSSRKERVTVVPGFVAESIQGEQTTLGRGGSDYSAAILAAALSAESLEIWTDVSGMYTADPRIVRQARKLERISYEEAMELSHFGARVLYPPSIQPVLEQGFPIHIRNTFQPEDPGTCIELLTGPGEKSITGISHVDRIALISLEGPDMVGVPGISRRFFEALSLQEISIVLITQASSEHSICIGISEEESERACEAIRQTFGYELSHQRLRLPEPESNLSIIALVGDQLKSHQGISGRMFSTLGRNNVNIKAIAQGASERNISAVIDSRDVRKALNSLHETFFEESYRQLNLFIMGVGNVGSRLLAQLRQQKEYLRDNLKLNIRVIGLANSRRYCWNPEGIDLNNWEQLLADGQPSSVVGFFEFTREQNLRNSIYVDNTASVEVAALYTAYLRNSIAVVTCNKIACSSELKGYRSLKAVSRKYNAPFLYETNVGAGLPIIDTLKNLIASGDRIHRIEAVVSGSLNFVWDTYQGNPPFVSVVRQAMEGGYTEPDPRIDLSGVDVMRKILILARDSGSELELDQIENRSFLPEGSLETDSVEEFLNALEQGEEHFRRQFEEAQEEGAALKYVAEYSAERASVGLRRVPPGHPFFKLEGSDNIVLFYTDRYRDRPLVVKGAGAGAEVTASGLFADLIRVGNL